MNEQTVALLQELANKLGTTSEYLWVVLIKQAPIQGTVMLVQYILTIAAIAAVWKWRRQIATGITAAFDEGEGIEVMTAIALSIGGVVSGVWLIACLFSMDTMVTAFMNPEYWALNKVLSTIKSAK